MGCLVSIIIGALVGWLIGLAGHRLGAWTYRLRTPLDLPLALFMATAALGLWAAYHRDSATAYQPFDNAVGWQKFGLILAAAFLKKRLTRRKLVA